MHPNAYFKTRHHHDLLRIVGVFSGARVAQYAGSHLHKKILSDPAYSECCMCLRTLHDVFIRIR